MTDTDWQPPTPRGETFDRSKDGKRLADQARRVRDFTLGRGWLTLAQIAAGANAPEASASARIRDLRRSGYVIERRRVPNGNGLHEYQILPPPASPKDLFAWAEGAPA